MSQGSVFLMEGGIQSMNEFETEPQISFDGMFLLQQFPAGILKLEPLEKGGRKELERAISNFKAKYPSSKHEKYRNDWDKFAELAPQSDDVMAFNRRFPVYLPLKNRLFRNAILEEGVKFNIASDGSDDDNYDWDFKQKPVYSGGIQWSGTRHLKEYYATDIVHWSNNGEKLNNENLPPRLPKGVDFEDFQKLSVPDKEKHNKSFELGLDQIKSHPYHKLTVDLLLQALKIRKENTNDKTINVSRNKKEILVQRLIDIDKKYNTAMMSEENQKEAAEILVQDNDEPNQEQQKTSKKRKTGTGTRK
jgi:hypothetical protein